MKKLELIEKLNNISGDFEVVFPNVEYGGLNNITKIYVEKVHRITENGSKLYPETGTDFLESSGNKERLKELYEEEEQNVIVLDW